MISNYMCPPGQFRKYNFFAVTVTMLKQRVLHYYACFVCLVVFFECFFVVSFFLVDTAFAFLRGL